MDTEYKNDSTNFIDSDLTDMTTLDQEITTTSDDDFVLSPEQLKVYMNMLRKNKGIKSTKKKPLSRNQKKSKRKSVKNARKKNRK